ncbi:MAG: cytochrome b6-f complex iron-sulfur subunit [Chloroflexota bacterium]|jgi:catechol-2,3-dioxygenase/nitrite reductase/ring-hydroxylating ferredoxin subunit|nr:cytochrome b6-f complex iron-sulfur subunit [Chloroflexota bacterium]
MGSRPTRHAATLDARVGLQSGSKQRKEFWVHCDRRAIAVRDLVDAEEFYVQVLGAIFGATLANRYGLNTDELRQGRRTAALARRHGADDDADELALPYSRVILGAARQAHVYLHLTGQHRQEPPPEQLIGAPRLGFAVTTEQMERAVEILTRAGIAFDGPHDFAPSCRVARALYLKDPSGNFLELCCPAPQSSMVEAKGHTLDVAGELLTNRAPLRGGEIHHLVLAVADLARARPFYEEALGLPVVGDELLPTDGPQLVFGLAHGAYLVLTEAAAVPPDAPVVCSYFSLAPAEWPGLEERLQRFGVPAAPDPQGGLHGVGESRLRVRDADEHELDLHTFADEFYDVPAAGRGKITAGRIADFPVGSVTRVPEGKFYLVHLDGGFLALSEVCTHRQFTVTYQPEHFCFACPLHGNRYSRTGMLIHRGAREATPPLHVYRIEFQDDRIMVDTDVSLARTDTEGAALVLPPA